jgi:hypothetical protein
MSPASTLGRAEVRIVLGEMHRALKGAHRFAYDPTRMNADLTAVANHLPHVSKGWPSEQLKADERGLDPKENASQSGPGTRLTRYSLRRVGNLGTTDIGRFPEKILQPAELH